ncbi:MAG: efflux RND transporter periplasmic adaptor subunit [Kaiparowitsia implicata GSE-PSE-MK54-09C]|jgi:HlyD family secretion protein|nr:efflux RND transporter periplasmic adaptor subunit [Kaiparowitsia implicata GSE-PSE-MK54-09C]
MTLGKQLTSPTTWRWGLIGGAIALGLLGLGLSRLIIVGQTDSSTTDSEVPAAPQRVEVVALGRVEPDGEVVRLGGPAGERIQELRVRQGDEVQAGEVIAVLESYGERQAERDYAATQLAEAQQQLRAQTSVGEAQIVEAQTRLDRTTQPSTFELASQQATIRELDASLSLAEQDLRRNQALFAEGAISRQDLDRQQTQVRELQERLNSAQANLARLERALQAEVRNAQAQITSQRANLSLSQVQAAIASAEQNLNLAEARLARTQIQAPQNGRVLRVITHTGETIDQGGGIVELGDTRQMFVMAEVYESDVGLVQLGQRATITSRNNAFSETLLGTVDSVGWQIFKNDVLDDDPAANADARVVEVKVRLDNGETVAALTNLQVDVRIDVGVREPLPTAAPSSTSAPAAPTPTPPQP